MTYFFVVKGVCALNPLGTYTCTFAYFQVQRNSGSPLIQLSRGIQLQWVEFPFFQQNAFERPFVQSEKL